MQCPAEAIRAHTLRNSTPHMCNNNNTVRILTISVPSLTSHRPDHQRKDTSTQPQAQAAYGQTSYPSSSFQLPHDPMHQSGQLYNYRGSPFSHLSDLRRLPPLSVPNVLQDRWQSGQYHYPTDFQMQPPANDIRSPQHSSRGPMPVAAPANLHHRQSMPMGSSSVDRTPHMTRTSRQLPYAHNAAELASTVDYPSDPSKPTIKKKHKRADACQLEVLNATYNRTAFPSAEERAALAKLLGMSARSVQIWLV